MKSLLITLAAISVALANVSCTQTTNSNPSQTEPTGSVEGTWQYDTTATNTEQISQISFNNGQVEIIFIAQVRNSNNILGKPLDMGSVATGTYRIAGDQIIFSGISDEKNESSAQIIFVSEQKMSLYDPSSKQSTNLTRISASSFSETKTKASSRAEKNNLIKFSFNNGFIQHDLTQADLTTGIKDGGITASCLYAPATATNKYSSLNILVGESKKVEEGKYNSQNYLSLFISQPQFDMQKATELVNTENIYATVFDTEDTHLAKPVGDIKSICTTQMRRNDDQLVFDLKCSSVEFVNCNKKAKDDQSTVENCKTTKANLEFSISCLPRTYDNFGTSPNNGSANSMFQ
jgi:hypothetical protein